MLGITGLDSFVQKMSLHVMWTFFYTTANFNKVQMLQLNILSLEMKMKIVHFGMCYADLIRRNDWIQFDHQFYSLIDSLIDQN